MKIDHQKVIAGRHIPKLNNNITECYVDIEVITFSELLPNEVKSEKTRSVFGNGIAPYWFEPAIAQTYKIDLVRFDSSFLRFTLYDYYYSNKLLAQATFPLRILRTGYRSVQLKNAFGEDIDLSSLLVYLNIREKGEFPNIRFQI